MMQVRECDVVLTRVTPTREVGLIEHVIINDETGIAVYRHFSGCAVVLQPRQFVEIGEPR